MTSPALVGRTDLLRAIERARSVWLASSLLGGTRVAGALARAAERGADVHVRLERAPYAASSSGAEALKRGNGRLARTLRAHGVDAQLSACGAAAPSLHLKGALVDGRAFLDDRNFRGGDVLVTTRREADVAALRSVFGGAPVRNARLAVTKGAALALEAGLIARSHDDVAVETESIGRDCAVVGALAARARSGAHVRVIVGENDVRVGMYHRLNPAVAVLRAAGAEVRVLRDPDKVAIAGPRAWLGSANATPERSNAWDWGMTTRSGPTIVRLKERFERAWAQAGAAGDPAGASQRTLRTPA